MDNINDSLSLIKNIKALIKKKYSLEEISETLRVKKNDVRSLLKELHISIPREKKELFRGKAKLDNKVLLKATRYFKKGLTLQKVAEKLQVKSGLLSDALKEKYGLSIPEIRRKFIFKFKGYKEEELIKLFKRYGSIPKVAKVTNIEEKLIRSFLTSEFGSGIQEVKKVLKVNKYNKCRLSEKKIKRIKKIFELYNNCGTLEATGDKLRVSRERVRQILEEGARYKVIDYKADTKRRKIRTQELKAVFTRKSLIKALIEEVNLDKICSKYFLKVNELNKLVSDFEIDMNEIKVERAKKKLFVGYNKIVQHLGYHPATTEMQARNDWRYINHRIVHHWGSMEKFRKEFAIEKRKHRFSEKFIQSRTIRMQKSAQKRELIYKFISTKGSASAGEITNGLDISRQMVNKHLNKLLEEDKIYRTGVGNKTRYETNN